MDATKRRRDSGEEPETMTRLPEDLVLEILTRLPARELGRCKVVCRLLKSLIGSPPFLRLYRRRNRCLMAYCSEAGRLHFYYSPIRSRRTNPDERFWRLGSLWMGRNIDPLTQPVNGVICQGRVADGNVQLTVYSVCTGQGLRIPPPSPPKDGGDTESRYSLGYAPRSRRYKLIRLIFRIDEEDGLMLSDHGMKAEVITLGPTGTVWKWRKLDDGAGIRRLPLETLSLHHAVESYAVSMFSGDGALCWLRKTEGMILFDMHRERFRWVKLPPEVHVENQVNRRTMVPRVRFNDNRLLVHLWVFPARGDKYKPEIECFVLEDEEGKVWKKSSEEFRAELRYPLSWYGIVNGSPRSDSSIMLMNCLISRNSGRRRELYCTNGMWKFWVGQPPDWKTTDSSNRLSTGDGLSRFSCFLDSNVLYLPLRDVLNGNGLV